MLLDIIVYDDYLNIPLRGLLKIDSSVFAFKASVLDEEEPAEIAARPGIYSRLQGFKCSDLLQVVMQQKDEIFRQWRAEFDNGTVDKGSHPLYTNPIYKELCARADRLFGDLGEPALDMRGLMRVVSGHFVLERIDVIAG